MSEPDQTDLVSYLGDMHFKFLTWVLEQTKQETSLRESILDFMLRPVHARDGTWEVDAVLWNTYAVQMLSVELNIWGTSLTSFITLI